MSTPHSKQLFVVFTCLNKELEHESNVSASYGGLGSNTFALDIATKSRSCRSLRTAQRVRTIERGRSLVVEQFHVDGTALQRPVENPHVTGAAAGRSEWVA